MAVITVKSSVTCSGSTQRASGKLRLRIRQIVARAYQVAASRKRIPTGMSMRVHCRSTTITATRNVITRNRTRPSQERPSFVLDVSSMHAGRWIAEAQNENEQRDAEGRTPDRLRRPCCALLPVATTLNLALRELSDETKHRQVHRNDHAADDDAEKHDHDRLNRGEHVFHRHVHFVFV